MLRSWRAVPYAALEKGELAGYVAVSLEGNELAEVVGRDGDTAFEIARAWVEQGDAESLTLAVGPLAGRFLHRLGEVCEASALRGSGNWQVFDWPGVISALLAAKAAAAPSGAPLADGRVTLGIGGYGAVAISAAAGEVSCERVEEPPAISCDPHLAHRLLFGPLAPSQSLPLSQGGRGAGVLVPAAPVLAEARRRVSGFRSQGRTAAVTGGTPDLGRDVPAKAVRAVSLHFPPETGCKGPLSGSPGKASDSRRGLTSLSPAGLRPPPS